MMNNTIDKMMVGNTLSLDAVLESAKEIVEKAQKYDETKIERFQRIVQGVARKYASIYVDKEDLEQELWISVLELIDAKGGEDNVDEKLVARVCWNKAVDFYRYSRRRVDSKASYTEGGNEDNEDDCEADIKFSTSGNRFVRGNDVVMVKEAIDLFPVGSRERKYVLTKLYMYGEIDIEDYADEDIEMPEEDTEAAILKLLGYNSRFPASWGKIKNEMRKKVYRYLGIMEGEAVNEEDVKKAKMKRLVEIFNGTSSYYIYTEKLAKDKALKLLGTTSEEIVELGKEIEKLVVGQGHSSKKFYLMKNEQKYVDIATEEGDKLFLKEN